MKPDLFTMCSDYRIINTCFFKCINASNPWMNYLMTLWEHLRSFWRLRNGTKISDAKCVRCYLEQQSRGNQVGGICFRSPTVSQVWARLLMNFSLRQNNGPRKPEMFYIKFDCYHLNQARPSGRVGPQLGPVQSSAIQCVSCQSQMIKNLQHDY
jgi:hypothetical protein